MSRSFFAAWAAILLLAPVYAGADTIADRPIVQKTDAYQPASADEQAGFWAAFGAPRSKADTASSRRIWATLTAAPWVAIGNPKAEKIIYAFSDTDCVYCHIFWRNIRPWVVSGQVQLRYLMVDYLGAHSRAMAAAILMSPAPVDTLTRYEQNPTGHVIAPVKNIPEPIRNQLDANMTLFHDIGFRVVPGVLIRDSQARIQRWPGTASADELKTMLGSVRTQ